MADIVEPAVRSRIMSSIRRRDTKPERAVRSGLWRLGYRYLKDVKKLPGRPDIALPKWHAAVFVHGCFWHAHEGCRYFKLPGSRLDFWERKFASNRDRDSTATRELLDDGWKVVRIWECAVRSDLTRTLELAAESIRNEGSGEFDIREVPGQRVVDINHAPKPLGTLPGK